jgi:hypothetical protein
MRHSIAVDLAAGDLVVLPIGVLLVAVPIGEALAEAVADSMGVVPAVAGNFVNFAISLLY